MGLILSHTRCQGLDIMAKVVDKSLTETDGDGVVLANGKCIIILSIEPDEVMSFRDQWSDLTQDLIQHATIVRAELTSPAMARKVEELEVY